MTSRMNRDNRRYEEWAALPPYLEYCRTTTHTISNEKMDMLPNRVSGHVLNVKNIAFILSRTHKDQMKKWR